MEPTRHIVIGNSIVRHLPLEGVTKFSFSGSPLSGMRRELQRAAVKIVVSGIPDIIRDSGDDHVNGPMVTAYEAELRRAAAIPTVILCPFYPTRSLRPSQWGVVHRLNQLICQLNAEKGEGTPAIVSGLFGKQRGSKDLYFRREKLVDEAHPGARLAESMAGIIKEFIWCRTRQRELRGALEFREELRHGKRKGEDLRTRMSSRKEDGDGEVGVEIREEVREKVIGPERDKEVPAETRRQRRTLLRSERDRREEDILEDVQREMESELEALRERYRETKAKRLEENDRWYRRRLDDLDQEIREEEEARDRPRREREGGFRGRDIRQDVPRVRHQI